MVNTRLPNRCSGRIGATALLSTNTKSAIATADPANSPIVGDDQAYVLLPQVVARVRPVAPRPMNRTHR